MPSDIFQAVCDGLKICLGINEKDMVLSLLTPGLTIDSSLDPDSDRGSENMFMLCDLALRPYHVYAPSGFRVSNEFKRVLNANMPTTPPLSNDQTKRLNDAYDYTKENSKEYGNFKSEIDTLQSQYNSLRISKNPSDVAQAQKCKKAMTELKQKGKDIMNIYEQHKNIILDLTNNSPADYFRKAGALFNRFIYRGDLLEVRCLPYSWYSSPDSLSWTEASVAISHKDTGAVSLLRFQAARVMLMRDWLDYSILSFKNVSVEGMAKCGLSSGNLDDTDKCSMPTVPTSIIITKDIKVYVEFYDRWQELLKISATTGENGETCLGPFALPDKTVLKTDITTKDADKYQGYFALSAQNMQISAFVSSLVPAFPHM